MSSKKPAATTPTKFQAPTVDVGQIVLWSGGSGENPCPAFVLKVGAAGSLTLGLHVDGVKDHVFKSGVRHGDDPWLQTVPEHSSGTWRLTPRDIKINAALFDVSHDYGDGEE